MWWSPLLVSVQKTQYSDHMNMVKSSGVWVSVVTKVGNTCLYPASFCPQYYISSLTVKPTLFQTFDHFEFCVIKVTFKEVFQEVLNGQFVKISIHTSLMFTAFEFIA